MKSTKHRLRHVQEDCWLTNTCADDAFKNYVHSYTAITQHTTRDGMHYHPQIHSKLMVS